MTVDLRLGDCLEILPTLADKSVDAVITDPPYPNNSNIMADEIFSAVPVFEMTNRIYNNVMLWFWNGAIEPPFCVPNIARHVWHKTNGWQAGKWEAINEYRKDGKRREGFVFSFPNVNIGDGTREELGRHPSPKPVKLMIALIEKYTNAGDTILDPFMGSGTTGVAAVKLSRNFIGIEKKPEYFAIAERRIAEAQQQMVMELA